MGDAAVVVGVNDAVMMLLSDVVVAGFGVKPRWVIRDLLSFVGAGGGVLMGDAAVVIGVNDAVEMLLSDAVVGGGAARGCRDAVHDEDDDDDADFLLHDG